MIVENKSLLNRLLLLSFIHTVKLFHFECFSFAATHYGCPGESMQSHRQLILFRFFSVQTHLLVFNIKTYNFLQFLLLQKFYGTAFTELYSIFEYHKTDNLKFHQFTSIQFMG